MTESNWPSGEQTGELLLGIQNNRPNAVDELLGRHRESLRFLIKMRLDHRLQRRVDVSDVLQEVLIEAHRRLADYLSNPVMPFNLWIRQIAMDRIIDAHRRHRVSAKRSIDRERPMVSNGAGQSTIDLIGRLFDNQVTPAAAAVQRELATHVQQAVEKLDNADREMIFMRHYEQLSNQEIARCLGLSEPATCMRYLRALRRLRVLLEGDGAIAGSESD